MKYLTAIIYVFLGALIFWTVASLPNLNVGVPHWDEAAHGFDGVAFADAFRSFSIFKLLKQVQLSAYWPPLFPFFEAAIMTIFGFDFQVARLSVALLSSLNIILIYFAVRLLLTKTAIAAGLFTSLGLLMSPSYQLYSSVTMLEIPGIFMTLLCLIAFFSGNLRFVAIASAGVFFTKYNYAVMWLGSLVLWQLMHEERLLQKIKSIWKICVAEINLKSPFQIFSIIYLLFLAYIQISKGFDREFFGQRVILKDIWGNPIYLFVFLFLIRSFLFQRKKFQSVCKAIWNAPEPWQSLIRYTATPIAIWLVNPQNFSTFIGVLMNGSSRSSWLQVFTYYPNALLTEHVSHPAIGILCFIGLVVGFWKWKSMPQGMKFLLLFTSISFLEVLLHPNYISRYLLTVLPFLLLNAFLVLFWLTDRKPIFTKVASAVAIVCFFVFGFETMQIKISKQFDEFTGSKEYLITADALCQAAKDTKSSTIIGYNELLSPSTIAWRCKLKYPDKEFLELPKTLVRHQLNPDMVSIEEIVNSKKVERFIVLKYQKPEDVSERFVLYYQYYFPLIKQLEASAEYKKNEDQVLMTFSRL